MFLRQVSPGTDQAYAMRPGAKHTTPQVIAIVSIVVVIVMMGMPGCLCVGTLARLW